MKTSLEILKTARKRLAEGWTKHDYYEPSTNKCCAVGALTFAVTDGAEADYCELEAFGDTSAVDGAAVWLADAIPVEGEGWFGPLNRIIDFNDNHAETVDDVLEVFDKAITRLEAESKSEPTDEVTPALAEMVLS